MPANRSRAMPRVYSGPARRLLADGYGRSGRLGPCDATHAHLPRVTRSVTADVDAVRRDRRRGLNLGVAAAAVAALAALALGFRCGRVGADAEHAGGESRSQQAGHSAPRELGVQ